ncbi:MAG: helicase-associated domain-containing protein, partial [Actinomycetota bacterium]
MAAGVDTLLLQLEHPDADRCRRSLARFAQLERSPGLVETYRLTDLGLWNAKAAGLDPESVLDTIARHSNGSVPQTMANRITETMDRFGPVTLEDDGDALVLRTDPPELLDELLTDPELDDLVGRSCVAGTATIEATARGRVKLALTRLRRPAD